MGLKIYSDATVLQLHNDGLSNQEIRKQLNCGPTTVNRILHKNGIKSSLIMHKLDVIDEHQAYCYVCTKIKELDKFRMESAGSGVRFRNPMCRSCVSGKKVNVLNNNIEKFLMACFGARKRSALKAKQKFDISSEDFIKQYFNQKGLCFYTDVELKCRRNEGFKPEALSIDKVVPELGYIKGNVVFCCYRINSIKRDVNLNELKEWMPKWYKRVTQFWKRINFNPYHEF